MNTVNTLKKTVLWKDAFKKVIVEPATQEETIQILNNIKSKYEDHHNVTIRMLLLKLLWL